MPLIDFKEIPSSKGGDEGQDSWALFAREYFSSMGLNIEQGPDRCPDSGRDLIIIREKGWYFEHGRTTLARKL
jgi:hypothetical protein